MIPKIIHYCWLSKDKKPDNVKKCIDSWHRYLPDYDFRLWDITSFDFDSIPFTKNGRLYQIIFVFMLYTISEAFI